MCNNNRSHFIDFPNLTTEQVNELRDKFFNYKKDNNNQLTFIGWLIQNGYEYELN